MTKAQGIEIAAQHFTKELPAHVRTFFLSEDDQDVFMSPHVMGGDPESILLCSMADGAAVVQNDGYTYVSSNWALRDLEDIDKEKVRDFADRIRKCLA